MSGTTGPSPATGSSASQLYFNGVVVGNGADTTEDTLMTFTIPAATLVNVGDTITIRAGGGLIGSTDNKTAKIRFGNLASSTSTTTAAVTKWAGQFWITKTGANTQSYMSVWSLPGAAAQGTTSGTGTITDTSAIVVSVTGQNITNSVANSITAQYLSMTYSAGM